MCATRGEPERTRACTVPDLPVTPVFAGREFTRVWAETYDLGWEPLDGRADLALVYGTSRRLGLRDYRLAPGGLSWTGDDDDGTVDAVLHHVRSRRTLRLTWNFRHDARSRLDSAMERLGASRCEVKESHTHVVPLADKTFDEIVESRVKPVRRREIRYAAERGAEIRPIEGEQDHEAHYALYRAWAEHQGIRPHPPQLYPRLARDLGRSSIFLGAYDGASLLAALLMFRDRHEWFYWHGVRDPERDRHFAMTGLLAEALRQACATGVRYFNLGASSGIRSLEFFKESWGAERRSVWSLRWTHPGWSPVVSLLRSFGRRGGRTV